ncbi:MAG: hypothetical protein UR67_C0001G0031 [candidate division CPR3 bacterium GW2011_GWF2_35_18]|uniref:Phage holin family protein n=1 Tax=candidate division CPR3 bacterium GW2011_GWF2_35_18 TaxID=1618350 RepID=A0A0G0ES04_UNCC3|nr:MAG: hypothetical protein UR67_C0001G0031 [candidate division CPR3 bacterium GW2011_GWF2_35_18]
MKRIFFNVLLNMISIAIVAHFIPGLNYQGGIVTLVEIAVILAIANIFVKPIIKILTLPIELVTLGLFGILINAAMLYLTAYFVPQFSIQGFYFTGIETSWFIINPYQIPVWGTAIISSVIIGVITSVIGWLID